MKIEYANGKYLVVSAAACMPNSCWGVYRKIAVVEMKSADTPAPKMISPRARGVMRIVKMWDRQHLGSTKKCAAARAIASARVVADELAKSV